MSESTEVLDGTETLTNQAGPTDEEVQAIFAAEYQKVSGQPAPEAEPAKQVEEVKQEEASTDTPDAKEQAAEWWASLPEEAQQNVRSLLDERRSLEQNYRALHNRLAPTQRQLAEAQRRLKEQQTTPTPSLGTQVDASKEKTPEQPEDELWSKVKDSDPVLAEAIEKLIAKREKEMEAKVDQRLRPIHERTQEDTLERETQTLLSLVPNAVEVFTSPLYDDWLKLQPASVQAMHESSNHQDALALLRLFDSDVARYQASQQPVRPQASSQAQQIQQRREEKLKNPIPAARPAVANAAQPKDDDATALFDKFFSQELKQTSLPYGNVFRR